MSAAVAPRDTAMHPDTCAALRLLVLALTAHPEDIATLAIYGDMPEHLTDVIADISADRRESAISVVLSCRRPEVAFWSPAFS